jgi:hypothetical protein
MFRLWGRIFQKNRMIKDIVITDNSDSSRTAKVVHAVEAICREFDLAQPIWLDSNIREFQLRSKTRFGKDHFIESIDFDYLEISVLEDED